jgi:3',5'-cyclic AMP phosphodiesterase CpdA
MMKVLDTGRPAAWLVLFAATWYASSSAAEESVSQEPLCRVAVMSNAYITALPAEDIREPSANGLGKSRSWLKNRALSMRSAASAAIRELNPDAFILLGSVTWTGSEADCEKAKRFLADLDVPVYVTPGARDLGASEGQFQQRFSAYEGNDRFSVELPNAHFMIATCPGESVSDKTDDALIAGIREELQKNRDEHVTILFGGPTRIGSRPTDTDREATRLFWDLVEEHHVALQILPGHDHLLSGDVLPRWTVPSMAWQERWSLGLIDVYSDKVDVHLIATLDQPWQTFTVPNPSGSQRLVTAERDPYGNPFYTQDLSEKPLLSFVHATDSQIDDGTDPKAAARYPHDEKMSEIAVAQVNRLKPEFLVVTGDLVNKNTLREWETFNAIYSKLEVPLYLTPGNHDAAQRDSDPRSASIGRQDTAELGLARYSKSTERYASGGRRFYSFEASGCVFLAIDTHTQAIDSKQMDWIRDELARTQDATHVFVLGHHPLPGTFGNEVAPEQGGDELLALFKQFRVTAYLVGHRHRASRYLVVDGTAHVHCEDLAWGERGAYHVYHVFEDKIVCGWKPVYLRQRQPFYERIEFPSPRSRTSK